MAQVRRAKPKAGEDDLEILNPDLRIPIAGETWTLREYGLIESLWLHALGSRAIASFDAGAPDLPALIQLIAEATGKDLVQIAGLPQPDLDALLSAWRTLNGPLFRQGAAVPVSKKNRTRWGTVYATLIAHGHDPSRIGAYTERQIGLYFECAQRLDGRQRIACISDVNTAYAGGKHADDIIKKLEKAIQ